MAVVTYEVYGHDGDHWRLEARYKEHQRIQALEQATDMADSGHVLHVKVVKEKLTDRGEVNQQTIFKRTSGNFNPSRLVGQRADRASAAASRAAEKAQEDRNTPQHPASRRSHFALLKVVLAVFGAAAAGLTAYSGLDRANLPWISSALGGSAEIGVGLGVFLGMAALLAYLLLQNDELPALFTAEVYDDNNRRKVRDNAVSGADETDSPTTKSGEDRIATETETASGKSAAEPPPDPLPPAPSPDMVVPEDEIDHVVIEKLADHRRYALFLAQSIWEAQTKARQGRPFTRRDIFATYLYIAGATDIFARRGGWSEAQARSFVQKIAAVISQSTAELRSFVRHYEELLTVPANIRMFTIGANAAAAFLANEAQAAQALTTTVDAYANDEPNRNNRSGQMTMLLTRAHETQSGADNLHLRVEVMDLHDAVVRAALEIHKGIEIRHTGIGILAGFDDTDAALAAAGSIAAQTDENTREQPLLAHHVAIALARSGDGKSLGMPGIGATVRLLDLVANFAGPGQIGMTESVARARRIKTLRVFDAGAHVLGEFPTPFKLFYLGWTAIESTQEPAAVESR